MHPGAGRGPMLRSRLRAGKGGNELPYWYVPDCCAVIVIAHRELMLFTRTEIPEPVTGPQALNWVVFALNMAILVFSVTLGLRMWLMAPERRPSASAEIVRDEINKALENSVRAKGCIVVLMDAREGHICQGHRAELFNIQAAQRNAYFISVAAQKAENTWENFIAGRSEAWQTLTGKAWSRHKFCLGREWLAKSDRDRFGVGNVVLVRCNARPGAVHERKRCRAVIAQLERTPDVDDDKRQGLCRRRGVVAEPARVQSSSGGRGVARKTENAADRRCRRRTGREGAAAGRERVVGYDGTRSCVKWVQRRARGRVRTKKGVGRRQGGVAEPAREQSSGSGQGVARKTETVVGGYGAVREQRRRQAVIAQLRRGGCSGRRWHATRPVRREQHGCGRGVLCGRKEGPSRVCTAQASEPTPDR
ncbi:hypothetical protein C8R43DRAFT_944469 [Mycena crocata]|nr:hypothetical protein C8R43DRAFT_944469 [Mycena crocata]